MRARTTGTTGSGMLETLALGATYRVHRAAARGKMIEIPMNWSQQSWWGVAHTIVHGVLLLLVLLLVLPAGGSRPRTW